VTTNNQSQSTHLNRKPYQPKKIRKKNKKHRFAWVWLGLGMSSVAMLSATAGAWLAVSLSSTPLMRSKLSPEEASVFAQDDLTRTNLNLPELTRPVNILVMGTKVLTSDLDRKPKKDLGYHALVNSLDGLADVMLLVRFDPNENRLVMLNIPRDTRAFVEGVGTTKLNEANYYGGPSLAAKSISELLGGVTIDRYVRVNVQGVEKLIDTLGGVTVYVPKDMEYQDDSQHLYIDLEKGKQHLDGDEALQFLRYRHDGLGDIGRIQRQQMMMRAMVQQTLKPSTVTRLPKILSVIQDHIDTNLSVEELVALVGFALEHKKDDLQMLMLPGRFNDIEEYNNVSYWLPNYQEIDTMMAEYFDIGWVEDGYEVKSPSQVRVAIQNSTENREAAYELIDNLSRKGYRSAFLDEPWPQPLSTTRIVAQQGDVETAKALRRRLGFGEIRIESTGNLQSDITIQLGQDWLQKRDQKELPPGQTRSDRYE
jgi:LCP family protein required for cell wall assembly